MSNTGFPYNIVNFLPAMDLTAEDVSNVNGFQTAYKSGNLTLAASYLSAITNYSNKQLTASRFNPIATTIEEIETFYQSLNGVQQYLAENINLYTDVAQWSSTLNYSVGSLAIVSGVWYIALQANINQNPTTTTAYWQVFISPIQSVQYYVGTTPPSTLPVGTIWFDTNV